MSVTADTNQPKTPLPLGRVRLALCLVTMCLIIAPGWDNHAVAEAPAVVVAADSRMVLNALPTGEVLVDQYLHLSRPLQDLGLGADDPPESWSDRLEPGDFTPVSATPEGDTLHIQYKYTPEPDILSYQLTLPAYPLGSLADVALLQYTIPVEINQGVEVQVAGYLTGLSGPISGRLGGHSQFSVDLELQTISRATIRQSVKISQPDLVAIRALRSGLPPMRVSYFIAQPSPREALPYRVGLSLIGAASVAVILVSNRMEVPPLRLKFSALNFLLAFSGFLIGGAAILIALVYALRVSLPSMIRTTWPFLVISMLASRTGWLLLIGIGCFLGYWAFTVIRRAVWTRVATLAMLLFLTIQVYGLVFSVLPFAELMKWQRMILLGVAIVYSAIVIPIFSTMAQPHDTYYLRD